MVRVRNPLDQGKLSGDTPGAGLLSADAIPDEIQLWEARARAEWQELRRLLACGAGTAHGTEDGVRYQATVDRFIAALRELRTRRA
jgi:hypothetical protein